MINIKKSVVVFDFDGTLADSFPLICTCFLKILPKYGVTNIKKPEDLGKFYGPSELGMLKNILNDYGKAEKAFKDYLVEYEKLHKEYLPSLYPGMLDLLKELRTRRTLRLALVTGRAKESLEISMNILGLNYIFEDIETGSPKGVVKPELMRDLFKNLGVDKNECIYIGDSTNDIKSMNSIGVSIISAYYNNPNSKEKLEAMNPNMCVGNVDDLRKLLLKNIR